jgi:hypothetical protein
MRKVVAGLFMSLDGVVESPDKWGFQYFTDEMYEVMAAGVAQADSVLLGRRTYVGSPSCGRPRAATCRWPTF